ncbi:MAG: glycosyltransferase family 4 protein [Acidobacteriales bacterium]|nr:glycosyltransferase family 4 protein [Terriglobales bacterium]
MRIAQVAPLFESVPPKLYGGTQRVVHWLTEELVAQGHEVTLFASGDSITSARLVAACPRALRLDKECRDQLAHHIIMLDQVMSHRHEFDLVHFHLDYLQYPLSRALATPQVTTLHGRLDLPDLVPLHRRFRNMPVISISDAQRAPLPWLNWQGTVHHGMPTGQYEFHASAGKYLAFLGRTSPEKGLEQAIAIAKLAGIPLKIAAKVDPADAVYFREEIEPLLSHPLVEFIGEIGESQKNEFLGNALALLFPICWPEPFGLVMMEAMACGTPVVAFARGSVPEVMTDGISGYVVGNAPAAASALHHVESFDRARCRRYFERHFTSTRMAQEYVTIYKRLAHGDDENYAVAEEVLSWSKLTSRSSTT